MTTVKLGLDCMLQELEQVVDVRKLKDSKELRRAIEDDAKRTLVDAAKKRAAAQNVDYPCFAALVSCAHLRPMTRKEMDCKAEGGAHRGKGSTPAWSFDTCGQPQADSSEMHVEGDNHCVKSKSVMNWRRRTFNDTVPTSDKPSREVDIGSLASSDRQVCRVDAKEGSTEGHSEPLYTCDAFIKNWKRVVWNVVVSHQTEGSKFTGWFEGVKFEDIESQNSQQERNLPAVSTDEVCRVKLTTTESNVEGSGAESSHLTQSEKQTCAQKAGRTPCDCKPDALMTWAGAVLDALRYCGRFGLALKLVGSTSRQRALDTLQLLSAINCYSGVYMKELKSSYGSVDEA